MSAGRDRRSSARGFAQARRDHRTAGDRTLTETPLRRFEPTAGRRRLALGLGHLGRGGRDHQIPEELGERADLAPEGRASNRSIVAGVSPVRAEVALHPIGRPPQVLAASGQAAPRPLRLAVHAWAAWGADHRRSDVVVLHRLQGGRDRSRWLEGRWRSAAATQRSTGSGATVDGAEADVRGPAVGRSGGARGRAIAPAEVL